MKNWLLSYYSSNTSDTISNLGGALVEDLYDPNNEGALRINLMKRPFTDEGITQT